MFPNTLPKRRQRRWKIEENQSQYVRVVAEQNDIVSNTASEEEKS